ncbi:hypothetical protein AgCh_009887 [Apium graveolens]
MQEIVVDSTMEAEYIAVSKAAKEAIFDGIVKKQRLSKSLTIPEGTTVYDACRRIDARRIDAVLLTDANALLSGIVTDKVCVFEKMKSPQRPEVDELFDSLEGWARDNIPVHLKSVENSWQPQDYLPDPISYAFEDQVKKIRERAKDIPADYYVVLVGDMITEEALPTYMSMLNRCDGIKDETGASPTTWATWIRAWTTELSGLPDIEDLADKKTSKIPRLHYSFIEKAHWDMFFTSRTTDEFHEIHKTQSKRRRLDKYNHRMTHKDYDNLEQEMIEADPTAEIDRSDTWVRARQDEEGNFQNDEAKKIIEDIIREDEKVVREGEL